MWCAMASRFAGAGILWAAVPLAEMRAVRGMQGASGAAGGMGGHPACRAELGCVVRNGDSAGRRSQALRRVVAVLTYVTRSPR
jgi:hypothetical protein